MNAKITTLKELQGYAQGQVVELPAFAEGQPFVARLCRPSIINLAKSGKIPNSLLASANSLFTRGRVTAKDEQALGQLYDILDVFCEACFLEPTYEEIKNAGITLTDEQLMFVFNYSQTGVRALESFRNKSKNIISNGDSTTV